MVETSRNRWKPCANQLFYLDKLHPQDPCLTSYAVVCRQIRSTFKSLVPGMPSDACTVGKVGCFLTDAQTVHSLHSSPEPVPVDVNDLHDVFATKRKENFELSERFADFI